MSLLTLAIGAALWVIAVFLIVAFFKGAANLEERNR